MLFRARNIVERGLRTGRHHEVVVVIGFLVADQLLVFI